MRLKQFSLEYGYGGEFNGWTVVVNGAIVSEHRDTKEEALMSAIDCILGWDAVEDSGE